MTEPVSETGIRPIGREWPIPRPTVTVTFITMNQLAARYNVARNTIGQWAKRRAKDFPLPIKINGRSYWSLTEIEAWDRAIIAAARQLPPELVSDGKRNLVVSVVARSKRNRPTAPYVQPAWARPKTEI